MPKTRSKRHQPAATAPSDIDISTLTLPQIMKLPCKSLKQHLSSRQLNTTGTKTTLANRLYNQLHLAPSSGVNSTSQTQSQQGDNSTSESQSQQSQLSKDSQLLTVIQQLLAQVATPVPPTGHIEDNVSLSSHQEFTPPRTADTAGNQQPTLVTTLPTVNAITLPRTSPPTNPIPMMPAVPTRIRDRILNGEFIDFATLLPQAMFAGGHMEPLKMPTDVNITSSQSFPSSSNGKRITNFATWMEAWNIYISVILSHSPERALEMVAYQRLITSASNQLPFANWCTYDVKFRTLAAADTTLRWDLRHIDLWLECTAPSKQTSKR